MATVTAKVLDNNNDPVSGDNVTLTSSGISGSPSASTDGTGVATFTSVQVGTAAGSYSLIATEGNNGHFVSAPFDITPGDPADVQFTVQPTDTEVDAAITPAVEVTVTDSFANPVPSTSVSMDIAANPGPGILSGNAAQNTDSNGVATFNALSIDTSSSGYTLAASVSPTLGATSNPFDITSFSVDCNGGPCHTGTVTSGTHSVSVNADGGTGTLSITFESQPLDCGTDFGGVGANITLDPPQGSPAPPSITVTFDDTISAPFQNSYPVCKTVESGEGTTTEIVPFCSDNPVPALPCVDEQSIRFHGSQPPTLHTVMLITQTDPRTLH
jgi:hypothetical protein